jgi:hypothetical protein
MVGDHRPKNVPAAPAAGEDSQPTHPVRDAVWDVSGAITR